MKRSLVIAATIAVLPLAASAHDFQGGDWSSHEIIGNQDVSDDDLTTFAENDAFLFVTHSQGNLKKKSVEELTGIGIILAAKNHGITDDAHAKKFADLFAMHASTMIWAH
jgi:hypothetical protein